MFMLLFTFIVITMVGKHVKMTILLIFSGLGHNRGDLSICMTSLWKHSKIGASHCIHRKNMANDWERKKNWFPNLHISLWNGLECFPTVQNERKNIFN